MGTNFYINNTDRLHIGKRSAAGLYCWNCQQTLNEGGVEGIHTGRYGQYDNCPDCGEQYKPESLSQSSGGVELGFAKTHSPHKGVTSIASFTWAINPSNLFGKGVIIIDEYGRKYGKSQFTQMLSDMCPIEFYHSIGIEFS